MIINRNKKIFRNTLFLYFRMILVSVVSLYTVRIVLSKLGIENYGIYNIVGGLVSIMTIITSTMTNATQRYYFVYIENQKNDFLRIYSTIIVFYAFISIVVFFLGETIGLWFVNYQLNIPLGRMRAGNLVYQFAILSFIFSMISIPFSSLIIANEDFSLYAYLGISDSLLKLLMAFSLSLVKYDKLIAYGFFMLLISLVNLSIYYLISIIRYKYRFQKNEFHKETFREILSFSGWSLFGTTAYTLNNQGNNILINIFFGTTVNAANGISAQVSGALSNFSNSFFTAVRPPLVKSYVDGNKEYMFKLFYFSNKILFYLMIALAIPIFISTKFILHLWLPMVTDYMIVFTKLSLIFALILSLNLPITTLIQATGEVKHYYLFVDSFTLLCLPVTFLLFKLGFNAEYTYYGSIGVFIVAHFIRLIILKRQINSFNITRYITSFILPAMLILSLSCLSVYFIQKMNLNGMIKLFLMFFISFLSVGFFTFVFGLNDFEKEGIKSKIYSLMLKIESKS